MAVLTAPYMIVVASITETMLFEVLSISRPCEVGKIDRNKRIWKKKVAKTTIMNIAMIIKIKIPDVFILLITLKDCFLIRLYSGAAVI